MLPMPAARSQSATRAVFSKLCERLTAVCTRVLKSCTPRLGPGNSRLSQHADVLLGQRAGVDLNRQFGSRGESKVSPQCRHSSPEIVRRQNGWRTAAPMQVGCRPAAQDAAYQGDFVLEQFEISFHGRVATRDGRVATAVKTKLPQANARMTRHRFRNRIAQRLDSWCSAEYAGLSISANWAASD